MSNLTVMKPKDNDPSAYLANATHERFAMMFATGEWPVTKLLKEFPDIRQKETIYAWKKRPEVAARIKWWQDTYHAQNIEYGIGNRAGRLNQLISVYEGQLVIRYELSVDPIMAGAPGDPECGVNHRQLRPFAMCEACGFAPGIPGGKSGFMFYKPLPHNKEGGVVIQPEIKTDLMHQMRMTLEAIAKERGEWLDKTQMDVQNVTRTYKGVDLDAV